MRAFLSRLASQTTRQLSLTRPSLRVVPLRSHKAPPAHHHSPENAHRREGSHLPYRRSRIPDCRSSRARRKRGKGPQGQAHHPTPPAACDSRRRRTRYIDQSDNRLWWCTATHQPCAATQGRAEEERQGDRGIKMRSVPIGFIGLVRWSGRCRVCWGFSARRSGSSCGFWGDWLVGIIS